MGSSTSSRKSLDSGVSLWSRLAGSLHRHQSTARASKNHKTRKECREQNESIPQTPETTRVMAFVTPQDESPKMRTKSASLRKMNKRKLAPPEPGETMQNKIYLFQF